MAAQVIATQAATRQARCWTRKLTLRNAALCGAAPCLKPARVPRFSEEWRRCDCDIAKNGCTTAFKQTFQATLDVSRGGSASSPGTKEDGYRRGSSGKSEYHHVPKAAHDAAQPLVQVNGSNGPP
jgi:hypothetical protein